MERRLSLTTGHESHAIRVQGHGDGDVVVALDGASVTTTAENSSGVWVHSPGDIDIDVTEGSIATAGPSAAGVQAVSVQVLRTSPLYSQYYALHGTEHTSMTNCPAYVPCRRISIDTLKSYGTHVHYLNKSKVGRGCLNSLNHTAQVQCNVMRKVDNTFMMTAVRMTALLVVHYEKPAKFSDQPDLSTQLLVPVQ